MKIWAVVIVALCGGVSDSQEIAFFQVSAAPSAEFPVLAGLDSAVELTADLAVASLSLLPGVFTVATPTTVNFDLRIEGQGQVIVFTKTFSVRGSLSISNSTITSSAKDLSMISLEGGSFVLKDASINGSSATVAAGTGSVALEDSNFTYNSAPAIYLSGGADLLLRRCSVSNQSEEFLLVRPKVDSFEEINIAIESSNFTENHGSGNLLTFSAPLLTGSITLTGTEFTENTIPLLYFDVGTVQISVAGCKFQDNSNTTLIVYAAGAVFTIADSLWRGNAQTVFDIRQLAGDFTATGVTVRNQRWKGIFHIRNALSADLCRFALHNSFILDTDFKVNEFTAGAIHANACIVLMTHCFIENVRVAAVRMRDIESLIMLKFGLMVVSNLTLHSSGSSSLGIAAMVGDLTITDSLIDDLLCGGNVYTGVTSGNFVVRNVTITQSSVFPVDEEGLALLPYFFAGFMATVEIHSSQAVPGLLSHGRTHTISVHYATVNITNYLVRDLEIDSIGVLYNSDGVITNVTVTNCRLGWGVFAIYNYQLMEISGLVVRDTFVAYKATGAFIAAAHLFIDCSNFLFHNFTARYIFASTQSSIHMKNISITDCQFEYILNNQVDANVSIEGLTVRRTTAGLAFCYHSSLRFVDAYIEKLVSNGYVIAGVKVNVTLERVTVKDFSSPLSLSRFEDNSHLLITQSRFSNYQSKADEGFRIHTGTVSIVDSTFRSFNVALLQARDCTVAVHNSLFQEGKHSASSSKGDTAFGGTLGCSDCPSVTVEASSFLNVTAIFGGAIAVRSANFPTVLHVKDCEFVGCAARAGGAVYLQQTSFLIEASTFIGNKAEETGGAIDAYTNIDLHTKVRSCSFFRNSAREGGSVKWKDSEVSFVNVSFQENSAVYGADIASFGVVLFGYIVSKYSAQASGYPLHLVFELQDHYRQRVTTAVTQDLKLQRSPQVDYRGNEATTANQGVFNFSELTIYAQPNSRQSVQGVMSYVEGGTMKALKGSVDVDFRDCVSGEVRKVDSCEYCFPGNVSFHPSDAECRYCPLHAFCPGGRVLQVDPHYWRSSNNSMKLIACPLRETCLGGENSECARGYTGKLCNECSDGYTRYRTIECEYCGSQILQWLKVSLIAVPAFGMYRAAKTASDIQLFVLKNILNHAQLLSVLSYIRVQYPTALKHFFHSLSYLSSLFITDLPLSCISSIPAEYARAVVGSAVTPTFLLVLFLSNRGKGWPQLWSSTLMFTPMITLSAIMPLLVCVSADSEVEWLFLDMKQQCWDGTHLLLIKAMIVPSVIINVIFPLIIVLTVVIASPKKFDALFPLWRSGVKWRCWDLLLYCGKCAFVVLIAASISAPRLSQVIYGLIVLIVVSVVGAGMGQLAFIHWKWFFLAESSLVAVAVSTGLCAYFIYYSPAEGVTDWLLVAAFLGMNVGYFAVSVKLWIHPPNVLEEVNFSSGLVPPRNSLDFP